MLRQEIEKILYDGCAIYARSGECAECIEDLDRICEAIGKTAEGMPEPECCKAGDKGLNNLVFLGAKEYRLTCQAYWQKELGKC